MTTTIEEERRLDDINFVMREREALEKACEAYITLLGSRETNMDERRRLVLQISQHLGNIGGFCDKRTKRLISAFLLYLGPALILPNDSYITVYLKGFLPSIVGIQVDFTKRPFKVIGLSVEAMNTKFNAFGRNSNFRTSELVDLVGWSEKNHYHNSKTTDHCSLGKRQGKLSCLS